MTLAERRVFETLVLEAKLAANLLIWPDQQGQRLDLLDAIHEAREALDAP